MAHWLRMLIPFLILAVSGAAQPTTSERAEDAGVLIDQVWSGHPVGFALLVEQGGMFVGYYDAERQLTVAARAAGKTQWTRVTLPGRWNPAKQRPSNVVGWDSHNAIVMAADREGHLHLSANMHVDPLVYYRTTRPWDVTSFARLDRMTGERETRVTYPHFFKDGAGELYFSYRDGSSGDAVDLYNIYEQAQRTWRRHIPTPLFDGEGSRSAYAISPQLGPDGRFHLLWMWRDTPDAATNQQLSYARSRDLLHWEDSAGREIRLPITFGKGERIDDAKPGEGLVNTSYVLGFDGTHRPVAFYHRYDSAGRSQIFGARPGPDGWERRPLTNWDFRWAFGGGGSLQVGVYLLPTRSDGGGDVLLPYTTRSIGDGILRVDVGALETREVLPAEPPVLREPHRRPGSSVPGMEVRTRTVNTAAETYVLRWETLPTNRDKPRPEIPPPTELRLFVHPRADR